jgi:hypothetical protein
MNIRASAFSILLAALLAPLSAAAKNRDEVPEIAAFPEA